MSYDSHFVFEDRSYYCQAIFPSHISFFAILMNLAAIFQVLEHLYDFWPFCFSKLGQNSSQVKHFQARTFHGLSLHSEAIISTNYKGQIRIF